MPCLFQAPKIQFPKDEGSCVKKLEKIEELIADYALPIQF